MVRRSLSAEDVLRLSFIRDARISADGQQLAYEISRTEGHMDVSEIWIHDFDSTRHRAPTRKAEGRYPRWSVAGQLAYVANGSGTASLVILSNHGDGAPHVIEIPAGTLQGPPAWSADGTRIAVVVESNSYEATEVRRVTAREFRADGLGFIDQRTQKICIVDVASGALSTIVEDGNYYAHLEWDEAGERLLYLGTSSPIPGSNYSPSLYTVRIADKAIRRHLDREWFIQSAHWLPCGQRFVIVAAYQSPLTIPTTDLWVVDCDGSARSCRSPSVKGKVGFRLHHDMPIWDLSNLNGVVLASPDSVWATAQLGGRAEIFELSLRGPIQCRRIIGGERACIALNASNDRRKLLFVSATMLTPPDLYIWDGQAEHQITHSNNEVLTSWPELRVRPLNARSADGLDIEGWFLAQAGQAAPVRTVMFIHGGPFIAAGHAFRFDLHLLASRGFGVLFGNFRGSFGYGEEFGQAVMGDWGARAFPDHMALVETGIALGLVDPARLGVWGASHGGFATCWLVGHTSRFRAAVAEAAVTNLESAYYLSDSPEFICRDLGGRPHEIPDVYRARSPLTYAHRCRTPTLLIHGELDLRCPMAEAEQFHRALLDVGCISELVRLRDANHMGDSIGPPRTRVAQNTALLEWFERFL